MRVTIDDVLKLCLYALVFFFLGWRSTLAALIDHGAMIVGGWLMLIWVIEAFRSYHDNMFVLTNHGGHMQLERRARILRNVMGIVYAVPELLCSLLL